MRSYSEYYETKLYPLQDGVLRCVEGCGTRFFLTGGTALSRGYFNHRYSDDLDFFVCADDAFNEEVELVLEGLASEGFHWDDSRDFVRASDFFTLAVEMATFPDTRLKLDFVNDVAPRFGDLAITRVFNRTDSLRNILSNKLTALFRGEAEGGGLGSPSGRGNPLGNARSGVSISALEQGALVEGLPGRYVGNRLGSHARDRE